jgi:hypothetical protein
MPRSLILVATLSFVCIVVAQTGEHEAQQELRSGEKISTLRTPLARFYVADTDWYSMGAF